MGENAYENTDKALSARPGAVFRSPERTGRYPQGILYIGGNIAGESIFAVPPRSVSNANKVGVQNFKLVKGFINCIN